MSFLTAYGPQPTITCCNCHRTARVVGAATRGNLARYKRDHVCGHAPGPWDVEGDPAPAEHEVVIL